MKVTSIELFSSNQLWDVNGASYAKFGLCSNLEGLDRYAPYSLLSVTGLDVDSLVPKAYGYLDSSEKVYGMRMPPRTIVMLLKLNPNYANYETPSLLRDNLYRLISSTRTGLVEIRFMDSTGIYSADDKFPTHSEHHVASIHGHITKFESNISAEEPQVQLTFTCPVPYLQSPDMTELVSLPITSDREWSVDNTFSTAPHGFAMSVIIRQAITGELCINHSHGTAYSNFNIDYDFQLNDTLYLSSIEDNRHLLLMRGSAPITTIQLADKIDPDSLWPILFPGDNTFYFLTDVAGDEVPISYTMTGFNYRTTYWGV